MRLRLHADHRANRSVGPAGRFLIAIGDIGGFGGGLVCHVRQYKLVTLDRKSSRRPVAAFYRCARRYVKCIIAGDPGSGKSVALRHVAFHLAARAARSVRSDSKLPVYVNLKDLRRGELQAIDRELIRSFVLSCMNRINDRFVAEFLEDNFDKGIKEGWWVFLFDSFDEIPDVLSSIEADSAILAYADAIADFLSGLNTCRGVVASRAYRGPARLGWHTFRVLALSLERQGQLIRLAFANRPTLADEVYFGLSAATEDVRAMSRNPMLLALICDHVRLGQMFPKSTFEVFSKYFDYRLKLDAHRVVQRFDTPIDIIQDAACKIAYTMTLDGQLGLAPSVNQLWVTLRREKFRISKPRLRKVLSALEFMKIGKIDNSAQQRDSETFTFSHRRFQEYFATTVVIAEPWRVPPRQLLFDARWREAAVVLFQTAPTAMIEPLVSASAQALEIMIGSRVELPEDIEFSLEARAAKDNETFIWPAGAFHLMSILQIGIATRAEENVQSLRRRSEIILLRAFNTGDFLDQRFVLELGNLMRPEMFLPVIRSALYINSRWLDDVIFQRISRLITVTDDVVYLTRYALLRMCTRVRSGHELGSIRALASRLWDPKKMVRLVTLAKGFKALHIACWISVVVLLITVGNPLTNFIGVVGALILGGREALLIKNDLNRFVNDSWSRTHGMLAEPHFLYILLLGVSLIPSSDPTKKYSSMSAVIAPVSLAEFVVLLITSYLIVWPRACVWAIISGADLRIVMWPFFPIVVAGRGFMRVTRAIAAALTKLRIPSLAFQVSWSQVFRAVGALAAVILFMSMLLGTGAVVSHFEVGWIITYGAGSIMLVGMGAVFSERVLRIVKYAKDKRLLREWLRSDTNALDPSLIVKRFNSLSTSVARRTWINYCRTKVRLVSQGPDGTALRELATSVQQDDPDLRDEVYRLVELLVDTRSSLPAEEVTEQKT